jgi:tRNA-specific 2-thiouridylase
MTNWEDDDGYCAAADDLRDARRVTRQLGVPLHRVNFATEYRVRVFADFVREHERGRTPNPDVLCNRESKFGTLKAYAARLGAGVLATGHYARLDAGGGRPRLLKGRDPRKDQSYFLCAVDAAALANVCFPLGDLIKDEVREIAARAGLPVSDKKDSTGICFIGERPFAEFLSRYVTARPGRIESPDGDVLGTHRGLAFYTLGQRQGLGIGGVPTAGDAPWYVAEKRAPDNVLVVVQGTNHPLLFHDGLRARDVRWIGTAPAALAAGATLHCHAKTRYRQADQACTVVEEAGELVVRFRTPQRAITPGQYVVLYAGEECLGGAVIEAAERAARPVGTAVQSA